MIVVSDTSPISNLIDLGHLDLMPKLFGRVIIPDVVIDELKQNLDPVFQQKLAIVKTEKWLEVISSHEIFIPPELSASTLNPGEIRDKGVLHFCAIWQIKPKAAGGAESPDFAHLSLGDCISK